MASILEIQGKKQTTYKVIIRIKGYKTICKSFKNITPAKQWAKKIESEMNAGTYKPLTKFTNINDERIKIKTMNDLISYFEKEVAPKRYADYTKYTVMYSWWKDKIGNVYINELSASLFSSCKQLLISEKIYKGKKLTVRKNNTINKYLMCISAVLTYAVKELEIIDINPMSKVSLVPKPNGRTRFLSIEEIKKFLAACKQNSDMVYLFALISLSTGARYNEVLTLKIENIDFNNSQIYYLNTKNKEHRGVFIEKFILNLINEYLEKHNIHSGYIFLNKKKTKLAYIRGTIQQIIKDIGLNDFHIHDLRHTTASYIAMNGGSLLDIAEILGHKSLVMARRYSHLTQKHTAKILSNSASKMITELPD